MKFTWYKPAKLVVEPSPFTAAARYAGGELLVQTGGLAEFVPAYGTDAGFAIAADSNRSI